MGKKSKVFNLGDLVFAKVKGYKPWPAKISKIISKSRFGVYFYGTGETGNIKIEDLDPYDEKSKAKYVKESLMKGDFKEAVNQIELAANGEDPAPIDNRENASMDTNEGNDTVNTTVNDTVTDAEMSIDLPEVQDDTEQTTTNDSPKENDTLEGNAIKNDLKDTKAIVIQQKRKTPQAKKIEVVPLPDDVNINKDNEKTNETESTLLLSRSGRKIKLKKNMDDDLEEIFSPRKKIKGEAICKESVIRCSADSTMTEETKSKRTDLKKKELCTQYVMIELIQNIKLSLRLDEANTSRCIELLESLKLLCSKIQKFMILKYPNAVETIKKLKKYIGNIHNWNMNDEELKEFQMKAQSIRDLADEIYVLFRDIFEIPPEKSFYQIFCELVKEFQQKVTHITDDAEFFQISGYDDIENIN